MRRKKGAGRGGRRQTSWDPLAEWYDGWVGKGGSKFHRHVAVPAVLELLKVRPGERVLDLGAGQGVLYPHITQAGGHYTGVDLSDRLIRIARKHHGPQADFIVADATRLAGTPGLEPASFDAAVFLLSLQDMEPLDDALDSASWALQPGGRLAILLTHPCFRIPRQSGWGWDEPRKLRFRRIDRYLTPLAVPLKPYPGQKTGVSRSFHRPLEAYINGLAASGLWVDKMKEIPTYKEVQNVPRARAMNLSQREIPLFLGLRARKAVG